MANNKKLWTEIASNTFEECMQEYERRVEYYDEAVPITKPDVEIVADELHNVMQGKEEARILDVAAGTGHVGVLLSRFGFSNMDALDGCAKMLEVAKNKGVYKNYYCRFFSRTPTPGLFEDTYDALVSSGSFGAGHLKDDSLVEFVRLAKRGGYIVLGILERYLNEDKDLENFDQILQELCDETYCELVRKQRYDVFNYAKTSGFVFIIKKL